ncbi:hypothetical protein B0H19DRAFT_1183803 [Mycena capillaripes]|nr:hypothetical protein B0H19DRAFT_1183803 [Mycena capillaripes]
MIGLVACGVQHAPFPDIVPQLNDSISLQSVIHFDTTPVTFDNNVAVELISEKTLNALVVGSNETTNSDKRIFSSDNNTTMLSFVKSPDLFASTCAELFVRMVDTVSKGLELTEGITPLLVRPFNLNLVRNNNSIQFSGEVRLWNMIDDPDRVVRLLWDDRVGGENNITLITDGVFTSAGGRRTAAWYSWQNNNTITLWDHQQTPCQVTSTLRCGKGRLPRASTSRSRSAMM